MPTLQLRLSLNDINLVLSALANLPFGQVKDIIPNITQQAQAQLQAAEAEAPETKNPEGA